MQWNKLEGPETYPRYGEYVLVSGIDKKTHGERRPHVCAMDDLEDGMDFKEKGKFWWLTEGGLRIYDVTHWIEIKNFPK